jgi:CDP-diacylglycerol pyrophosphatase
VSASTRKLLGFVLPALAVLLTSTAPQARADADALWKIVHDQCVPDQQHSADPTPCSLVDLNGGEERGYAVLMDIAGRTQFLVIPTARMSGIESPAILAPDATNYFAAAWRARTFLNQRAEVDVPRDWVSLAINSEYGRTQNQLHIHLDCVSADVRDALRAHAGELGPAWTHFPQPLAGHAYLATAVEGENLDAVNPFDLLADGVAGARDNMGLETLVVVGGYLGDGRPGFFLLAGRADAATHDIGSGEELQDHKNCPPPKSEWFK